MFIDVTRYGGMRLLRVAIAAIAYLDTVEGGCAIHLIGGETLRVNEDLADIEARCAPIDAVVPMELAAPETIPALADEAPAVSNAERHADGIADRSDHQRYPAKRGPRGRHGR